MSVPEDDDKIVLAGYQDEPEIGAAVMAALSGLVLQAGGRLELDKALFFAAGRMGGAITITDSEDHERLVIQIKVLGGHEGSLKEMN